MVRGTPPVALELTFGDEAAHRSEEVASGGWSGSANVGVGSIGLAARALRSSARPASCAAKSRRSAAAHCAATSERSGAGSASPALPAWRYVPIPLTPVLANGEARPRLRPVTSPPSRLRGVRRPVSF